MDIENVRITEGRDISGRKEKELRERVGMKKRGKQKFA